jgi:hypothetical protein
MKTPKMSSDQTINKPNWYQNNRYCNRCDDEIQLIALYLKTLKKQFKISADFFVK